MLINAFENSEPSLFRSSEFFENSLIASRRFKGNFSTLSMICVYDNLDQPYLPIFLI